MNWKNEAISDLTTYLRKKESLTNIRLQIQAINLQLTAVKGGMSGSDEIKGGGNHYEDRILDSIMKRDRLKLTYSATAKIVGLIEKGLAGLDETERLVLDLFYIHRAKGNVERLMDKLDYEKSQVYRLKDSALYKYVIEVYGIVEY